MTQAQTGRGWLLRLWPLVPIAAALIFTSGLLLLFDASPAEAYRAMDERRAIKALLRP